MTEEQPALLVVDDHRPNLVAMTQLLQRTGARIVQAASGEEALALFQEHPHGFALALLDIQMPGMDGYRLAEALSRLEQGRDLPVIFLTAAYNDDFHQLEAYRVGAVDYLLKPVDDRLLLAKVGVFLELARRRREQAHLMQLWVERGELLEAEVAERRRVEEVLRIHQSTLDRMIRERTQDLEKANRGLRTLSALNAILARAGEGFLGEICRALVAVGGYAQARVMRQEGEAEVAEAEAGSEKGERLRLPVILEGVPWGVLELREQVGEAPDLEMRYLLAGWVGNLAHVLAVRRESVERCRAEAALRRSEEQMRVLSGHMEEVREEERRWIVQEMHDELGSNLAHIKMSLSWLQQRIGGERPKVKERIQELLTHVENAISRMRGLTRSLRPPVLDHCGVVDALRWQVREFVRSGSIQCQLVAEVEEIALDEAGKTVLFRICQEALTNITRHAEARSVTLRVGVGEEGVCLEIGDDGRGFDPVVLQEGGRAFGLWGMMERARQCGGRLEIDTRLGVGTRIVVTLPVAPAVAADMLDE